jgi:hypothetical protein
MEGVEKKNRDVVEALIVVCVARKLYEGVSPNIRK